MRDLSIIAREIEAAWRDPKTKVSKVNYAARPYLDAMRTLDGPDDMYGYDDGRSIIRYFLSNATGWRGDDARRVKAELKGML